MSKGTRLRAIWDSICNWLAWHLPKRIAAHAYIRVHANATVSPRFADRTPDQVSWTDALDEWGCK